MKDFTLEKETLESTISIVKELLEEEKYNLEDLEENFEGDIEEYWYLEE